MTNKNIIFNEDDVLTVYNQFLHLGGGQLIFEQLSGDLFKRKAWNRKTFYGANDLKMFILSKLFVRPGCTCGDLLKYVIKQHVFDKKVSRILNNE